MSKQIGNSCFPATQNGRFACKCKFEVRFSPTPYKNYDCIGLNHQLFYPKNFTNNVDAMLSITSAYTAAIQSGNLSNEKPIYMTLEPSELPPVTGASEGIAALLAFLGCQMSENQMITGFVDTIGMTEEAVEDLVIKQIDEVRAKAEGAEKCGLTLFIPSGNVKDFGNIVPKHVVPVKTVGDAIKQIQQRKK